ncbi:MAG: FAD:protein FMN transferase [Sedimentisphaerales bacterium]|nr:FAD:protein FMN transferase [Sedimentisphaerales bacterium]
MKPNRRQILAGVVAGLCLIAAAYYVGKFIDRPAQVDGGYRQVMGTFARIVAVANKPRQARTCIEAGFDEIRRIEAVCSAFKADSELSKINREAFNGPVKVSPELFGLLRKSVEYSKLSNGAFDITVGPVVDLWRKAGEANSMPGAEALAEAKSRVGYEKLLLDANTQTIRFAVAGMRLDLGGIAKGYSVDNAVEIMRQKGAIAGMVDAGGNIYCFGKPLDKAVWLVGVQDPNLENSEPLMVLKLQDYAVATSGDYRRFVTIAGRKVSHIIDTMTATGANKLAGDTIIAKTAMEADAISTAVNVLGPEKGLALIESFADVECILITAGPEYRVVKSSGANSYIMEN